MITDSPKPINKPESENKLFRVVERKTVVKGRTPIQAQRDADGTPFTIHGPTALKPQDPHLVLKGLPGKEKEEPVDMKEVVSKSLHTADEIVKNYMIAKGFTNLPLTK